MKTAIYLTLFLGAALLAGCAKEGGITAEGYPSTSEAAFSSSGSSSGRNSGNGEDSTMHAQPGVITAGEWNDPDHWDLWQEILLEKEYSDIPGYWHFYTRNRISVHLTDAGDKPVADTRVQLKKDGQAIFTTRTDNRGNAELWIGLFQEKKDIDLRQFQIDINNGSKIISPVKSYQEGVNHIRLPSPAPAVNQVNISFVVDATGSMGDELEYLKTELYQVITRAKANTPDVKMSTAAVFYRDKGDEYLTRVSPFSEQVQSTITFISQQHADGGGDFPEAVHTALDKAVNGLQWSSPARARLLFLLLDAPPHYEPSVLESLQQSILEAAGKGIKIIPITASGIDKRTEFIMRFFAVATNGTYVFITDDSGVGNPHLKPTVGDYRVEFLNDLMVRLIHKYSQ